MKLSILELLAKSSIRRESLRTQFDEFHLISSSIVLKAVSHSLSLVHNDGLSRNEREIIALKFAQGLRDSVESVSGLTLSSIMTEFMRADEIENDDADHLLHLMGKSFFAREEPIDCDTDDLINSWILLSSSCKSRLLRKTLSSKSEELSVQWDRFNDRTRGILISFTGIDPKVAALRESWWIEAVSILSKWD